MARGRRASTRANHRRARGRNFQPIPFTAAVDLSTLADDTVLLTDVIPSFGEDYYCVSIDCSWATRDFTAAEGPIEVGFSHGDLSVTEVEEALDAAVTDPDDIIAREHSRRPVRRAGIFSVTLESETLNQGDPIRTPLKFSIGNGHALKFFAYNRSGGALTGTNFVVIGGTLYGRSQR